MAGEASATVNAFALQLLNWFREKYPDASSITLAVVENI